MAHSSELQVVHDADNTRFQLYLDGVLAGFAEYTEFESPSGAMIRDFHHTVIEPEFRGRGLSSPLLHAALTQTRSDGRHVRPTCSAVAGYIQKTPEFGDLLEA